jgi:hypothetical protein
VVFKCGLRESEQARKDVSIELSVIVIISSLLINATLELLQTWTKSEFSVAKCLLFIYLEKP